MYPTDTIAAIATPFGAGGIGIIKISGSQALNSILPLFKFKTAAPESIISHQLYYGTIVDSTDACPLDEVLLSYMKAPHTYTGEDVIEINCHSGIVILQKILDMVIQSGIQLAEPGEFTKRAFINGRMDLTQAEAVIDVIDAQSESALKIATRQLTGNLSQRLQAIQTELREMLASLEASIDFPEDNLEIDSYPFIIQRISGIADTINKLILSYDEGKLFRDGIEAAIIGKPNVGKSSLLNMLTGDTRAIVTPHPGTTRDSIQEKIQLNGVPVQLIDTAGLHESDHEIEKIGIDIARGKAKNADIVLLVIDGSRPVDNDDTAISNFVEAKNLLIIINKSDLPQAVDPAHIINMFSCSNVLQISAKNGSNIEQLKSMLFDSICSGNISPASDVIISNSRHVNTLKTTLNSIQQTLTGLNRQRAPELIAVDFQAALASLGEITGETTSEDILSLIFSNFCIGK